MNVLPIYLWRRLKKWEKSEIVDGLGKFDLNENYFCDGCAMGKMQKQPYKSRLIKSKEVGAAIHADLCGKMKVESLSRSQYYLELKDEASGYTKVYFIRTKDQVIEKLKQIIADQWSETGKVMKTFFSDNGTEFNNDKVKQFLMQHGIKHQMSAAYNPQQNGRAERENRTRSREMYAVCKRTTERIMGRSYKYNSI